MASQPTHPRRDLAATSRARSKTSQLLGLGLFFAAIGLFQLTFMGFVGQHRKDAELDRAAVEVVGKVTGKREVHNEKYGGGEGRTNHPFAFDFDYEYPEGVTRSGTSRTLETRLSSFLEVGDPVTIELLPTDPEISRIAEMPFAFGPVWIEVVVYGLLALGLVLTCVGIVSRIYESS